MKTIQKFTFLLFFLVLLAQIILYNGCSNKTEAEMILKQNPEPQKDSAEQHEGEVVLSTEQINFMGIRTEKLNYQNISGYIKVNGEIVMNPDNESRVGSLISGRIKKIYVREGTFVGAGQILALIENPEMINVQVEFIKAKNEFEYSKLEYERQLKLSSDNIGSKKTLAEFEAKYKNALADYKTYEQKLLSYKISKQRFENIYQDSTVNLQRYYSVTAPISGYIVKRMASVGQFVEPSTDLFQIVNTAQVFADLSIFEKDLALVSYGQIVKIDAEVNPYESYEGVISYINKVFDDKNRSVKVRVAINNRTGKLLPFMFVTAKIYTTAKTVLAVPISALETEGENKFIFIKTDEQKEKESQGKDEEKKGEHEIKYETGTVFKKISVNTGRADDKYIEIFPLDKLEIGNEVVTGGTFYLKSELMKGELEHEHH